MQLQVGIRKAEMGFAIIGLELKSGLKIFDGPGGLAQIVVNETAIAVAERHFGITIESASIVGEGLARLSVVGVHVAGDEGEILVVGKNGLIFGYERKRIVVTAEVVEIVGEVDDAFAIVRKFCDYDFAEFGRFGVVTLES